MQFPVELVDLRQMTGGWISMREKLSRGLTQRTLSLDGSHLYMSVFATRIEQVVFEYRTQPFIELADRRSLKGW